MDWCLNQSDGTSECNTSQQDGTEDTNHGSNTNSGSQPENGVIVGNITSQTKKNESQNRIINHDDKDDDDDPKKEHQLKLKKEHELDIDENPTGAGIAVGENPAGFAVGENQETRVIDEPAENFDFSIVCKLMDYKFPSGKQDKLFKYLNIKLFFISPLLSESFEVS